MKAILAILLTVVALSLNAQSQYHVITDQSFYFSGDEMYINVLKNDAVSSEIVTMILCDGNTRIIQGNMQMENGFGVLKFELPEKINSGEYSLQVWNQHEYVGAISVRINKRDDEDPQKEVIQSVNRGTDLIAVNFNDTIFTAQKASLKLTSLSQAELSSMSISITNRNPAFNTLLQSVPRSAEETREGLVVKGMIKDMEGKPLTQHSFMMVVPLVNKFYTAQSDAEGYFELEIDVFQPVFHAVFLSLSPQTHHEIQVDLIPYGCSEVRAKSSESVSAKTALVNEVINDAFRPFDFAEVDTDVMNSYRQYYDREVRPAEYTSSTMFQVFNDIVPKVHVRKNTFGMYALESTTKLKVPPLIFVNGIPTYDYEFVLDMDVDQVESIGVIASFKTLRRYFQAGNGGIIEINTVDKKLVPSVSKNIVLLQGIHQSLTDNVKIYSDEVSFSSLLLYEPKVELAQGETRTLDFETSLESGTYYFTISGITSDAEVFHQSIPFTINQANQ